MKFIKLTQTIGNLKGAEIYINTSDISFIRPHNDGTAVALKSGTSGNLVIVQEDINTVIDNITGKKTDFVFSIA